MKKQKLISSKELHAFPFLYKDLELAFEDDKISPNINGMIKKIQNDNAKLETFYKCISRF